MRRHAGFTGSAERIALGDEARKKEHRRKRQELRELIEQDGEGSADSQDEWEKAQMGRMGFRVKDRVSLRAWPRTHSAS